MATDHVVKSFRNDMWPGYKDGSDMPADILSQFPLLEEAIVAMGIRLWPMTEFEADDALAAAAAKAGFEPAPLVSQAQALTALGASEALDAARQRMGRNLEKFAAERRAVDTLLDPGGLGRIRVLAQAKDAPLAGLRCLQPVRM